MLIMLIFLGTLGPPPLDPPPQTQPKVPKKINMINMINISPVLSIFFENKE